jgi:ornithine cyclodeaminase/alanine dehydrogenase-like protein (mu-crystallin family)
MLFLSEQDVLELLPMRRAVELTRSAFASLADKTGQNQPRRRLTLPTGAILHQLAGAYGKYFGAKIYSTHVKHGAHFLVLLYDAETGGPLALIEANYLGQIRTGAASGVATDLLAPAEVRTLGVIGSGFQAETQVEAILAVRSFERVKVWSRKAENRNRFAELCSRKFGVPTAAVVTAEDAVAGADVIATATYAKDPVFEASWVKPGVHVNAAGSNNAQRRELPGEILERAALIAVDSIDQAKIEAGDLLLGLGPDFAGNPKVVEISRIAADPSRLTRRPEDTTVFKSVGLGLQDVAVAGYVYEEAIRLGKGSTLPIFHS